MAVIIKKTGLDEFLDPSGGAWVKALIMGDPGSGKTRSASAFPSPIYADCERGMASVADRAVPYAPITAVGDMDALLDHLRKDGMRPPGSRSYSTLVIDTIDSYQKIVMNERMRSERRDSLSMQDWGFIGAKMDQFIEKMLNLPMNLVVNMHVVDKSDFDGETEVLVKRAALKGGLADSIWNHFDLIGLMENSYVAEHGERVLKRQIRWHSEPRYPMLRDRFGKLPRFTDVDFTEDDYNRIFSAITSGVDDLPESTEVESLAVASDAVPEPMPADAAGGPVADPKLPAKKRPAKKTTKPAAQSTGKPATKSTAPATDVPTDTRTGTHTGTQAEQAEQLLRAELGATEVDSAAEPAAPTAQSPAESTADSTTGGEPAESSGTPVETVADDGEPTADSPQSTAVDSAVDNPEQAEETRRCGDAKPGMTPQATGCGAPLTEQNSAKVAIARLRTKTELCTDCFEAWKKAAS